MAAPFSHLSGSGAAYTELVTAENEPDVLAEVVRRVVEATAPERIVLFGSRARGDARKTSDFDLLIVKRGEFDKSATYKLLFQKLYGVAAAVDLVLVTPEEAREYRDSLFAVIGSALREGRTIYDAA